MEELEKVPKELKATATL
jgi:hypothetical protein